MNDFTEHFKKKRNKFYLNDFKKNKKMGRYEQMKNAERTHLYLGQLCMYCPRDLGLGFKPVES